MEFTVQKECRASNELLRGYLVGRFSVPSQIFEFYLKKLKELLFLKLCTLRVYMYLKPYLPEGHVKQYGVLIEPLNF